MKILYKKDIAIKNSYSILELTKALGEVPERFIGAVLKTVVRASVPWVRIPPSPFLLE